MTPLKQRGKIRRTNIYIYTIRLNNRPPLKQRGNIRRTYIYTKGGRSEGHIYILRGKICRTHIYTKREDLTDTYIY
jgi:hypothetical protein